MLFFVCGPLLVSCFSAGLLRLCIFEKKAATCSFIIHHDLIVASPDERAGAGADSFPPTGLWCRRVTMATFVRLQIQLLGEGASTLVAGVQGEVLGDPDLGGA